MDFLKQGRSLISEKMHNTMIQHSVFAAIVFLVVAHPKTFQFVDSIIKVHDKNILLLVHSLVVGLLMYFGSLYVFEPVQKVLLEGMTGTRNTAGPGTQQTAGPRNPSPTPPKGGGGN